ncbi:MAG TPA: extracellular solute-binding protein [Petrotogaceae bacterium]|nr:extracellular solute-binding protein [Petrotogaceae bacterium]HPO26694.1 extracellular solute-binding protein [Petrotogaceae bacterium]HQC40198.1 extracellular solute-binding protein [Petrotogaceae bacterium]HQO13031.1 extracellular solute-binding protein [Petrotogaceae bacterium]
MKKFLTFAFFVLAVLLVLTSCNKQPEKLYVYNWANYIPQEVVQSFEKEYNCDVVYDFYSSNEEMYAKLKAGGTGYDIIFPSADYAQIMINEDMLEKLDKAKVPNLSNIEQSSLMKMSYDINQQYCLPYMIGSTGLAVNTKYVKEYDHSWTIFERSDLKGKMSLLDDMRETLGAALKFLGYSVNTVKEAELEQAKQLVLKWKENILKFDGLSNAKNYANSEYYVIHGYGDSIFLELDEEMLKNTDYFIPKEGGTLWIDNMVMLKNSKHKELAYKFMNYIYEPKIYAQISDYVQLPSINIPAREFITVQPMYKEGELDNCELIMDLGKDIELYNKVWQEIRMQN